MINRMLELATIDGRKTALILDEFLLAEVVQEVTKSFEQAAKKKKQVISAVVPEVEIQADTGIGIPKDHLPKIFERFYIVDTSVTSEVGKGSKFFFFMPKRQ